MASYEVMFKVLNTKVHVSRVFLYYM